jgi:hypothetical protein
LEETFPIQTGVIFQAAMVSSGLSLFRSHLPDP